MTRMANAPRSSPGRPAAKSAATLAELGAEVDVIVTMLPTGKEVRACLLETEGGALTANLAKRARW